LVGNLATVSGEAREQRPAHTQQKANTTRKIYRKAIPTPLTTGLPSCCAVQAVIMATLQVMRMLPAIIRRLLSSRSMKHSPVRADAIIMGV
jgi:hypothetical protein